MITRDEAFALWRDKIESYEQGEGALREGNRFCCLGVLCDLLKDELDLKVEEEGNTFVYDMCTASLPTKVSTFMRITGYGHMPNGSSLASMNDTGTPFSMIKEYLYPNILKESN